jgi:putative ABC transport system permease protein
MNFLQSFRMSINAIIGKKARSFLTMLGMIIGVAAVIVLVSLTQAQNEQNMAWIRSMGTNIVNVNVWSWNNPGIAAELEEFVYTELSELSLGITPELMLWNSRVLYQSRTMDNVRVMFGSADFSICKNLTIALGRDLSYMDIQRNTRVAVLGSRIKEEMFNYMNPVGETITINGERYMVIGVYKEKFGNQEWTNDDLIVLPYTQTRTLQRQARTDQFSIKAKDAESTKEVMSRLRAFLSTRFDNEWDYNVFSTDEWSDQLDEMNRSQLIMLGSIAAISLIVGGIGIMNIMLVTVTERTREIGVRKAIGAPRRSIITQFLIEASVLSLIGGILGVLAGFLITLFWGKMTYDLLVLPTWGLIAIALTFSVSLGVGFGLYPAVKASALQPVVALRNE